MTISLEEFIRYLFEKWKVVLSIIIMITTIFIVGAFYIGDEIYVPHSEEYLHYEKEVAYLKNYWEESILMNLNPTSVYERTIYINNISEIEILRDYAKSQEIWNDIETKRDKTYIGELLTWSDIDSKSAEITLKHATSEECYQCAKYIEEKLAKKDELLEIKIGAERLCADEVLQDKQLRWYERIEYAETLLLNSQAGYTIVINKKASAIVGVFIGTIIAVIGVLSFYVYQEIKKRK